MKNDADLVKNEYPPFSVAMSVYKNDNPEWFDVALKSVIEQTVKPNEIVLVVDGPISDELRNIINKYENICKNSNIYFNVIYLEQNQGHGIARKSGLDNCSNKLVAIMDADDICVLNRFETQLNVFNENPKVDVVGGIITEFIDSPDNIVGKRNVPLVDSEIKKYMKCRCPMNFVTVMFKKSSIEKVGGFIDWFCEEDYYLWIRMALAEMKFSNVDSTLVNVRVGKDMYKRRGGLRYFISEARLQKYMRKKKVIGFSRYIINIAERFVVQVLMHNAIREWVFKTFARTK